jgi:hypothetical protein
MSPITLVSPEFNFHWLIIYSYFPHPPKSIPRIAPRCPHIPLHILMTDTLTKFLVEFNLESS